MYTWTINLFEINILYFNVKYSLVQMNSLANPYLADDQSCTCKSNTSGLNRHHVQKLLMVGKVIVLHNRLKLNNKQSHFEDARVYFTRSRVYLEFM